MKRYQREMLKVIQIRAMWAGLVACYFLALWVIFYVISGSVALGFGMAALIGITLGILGFMSYFTFMDWRDSMRKRYNEE